MKCYITLNVKDGWKIVLDGRHIDATKPIFDSKDITEDGLIQCRNFCNANNLTVIRECK